MAETEDRVLAIDADLAVVRGIVLAGSARAQAGGYAQLAFDRLTGPAAAAVRIARALDPALALPIVVVYVGDLGESAGREIVGALADAGFGSVALSSRTEAIERSNPGGGQTDELVDATIASGLLSSHPGLTLADLAPVVGAGLGVLGLGASTADLVPVDVWQPDGEPHDGPDSEADDEAGLPTYDASSEGDASVGDVNVVDDPFTSTGDEPTQVLAASAEDDGESESASDQPEVFADLDVTVAGAGIAGAGIAAAAASNMTEAEVEPPGGADLGIEPAVVDLEATVLPDGPAAEAAAVVDLEATVPPDAPAAEAAAVVDLEATVPPDAPAAEVAAVVDLEATVPPDGPAAEAAAAVAPNRRSKLPALLALLGLLAVAVVVAFFVLGGDSSTEVVDAPAATAEPESAQAESADAEATEIAEPTTVPEPTVLPEPTTPPESAAVEPATASPTATAEPTAVPEPTASPEPTATAEPTVDPVEDLPPLSSLPERGAIFRPPTLYLEGPVQTQEQADQFYEAAVAVVGPDNVVNNYVVRPDAPAAVDGNVRVEQAVLFESGSARIAEEFIPTLELGVAVMALNPQVTMIVEGHTDSVGSNSGNQTLSEARAQAVVDYLAGRGVAPERLEPVGFGETSPIASNDTAEGRQLNRRIEVNLLDLLTG